VTESHSTIPYKSNPMQHAIGAYKEQATRSVTDIWYCYLKSKASLDQPIGSTIRDHDAAPRVLAGTIRNGRRG
jgi:hypothetical protein